MDLAHIGRYEVHSLLGQGGMGTVYKARDPSMERWVAIKTITVQDVQQRARFQQEVRAAGAFNHPHITTIYDVGEEGDLAYIIMELVEGDTLASRLSSLVPWSEAVNLLLPICQALAYAHSRGVIHRGVKPANILISTEGQVKLTDFGWGDLHLRRIGSRKMGKWSMTPRPKSTIKNKKSLDDLINYLEYHRTTIPCYSVRKNLGLRNGSNPGEKANDLLVSTRQKHNGMSWSRLGSVTLASLTALVKNNEYKNWFSSQTIDFCFASWRQL